MRKKGQTEFLLRKTLSIIFELFVLIILLSSFFMIIGIFTQERKKQNAELDFSRITAEMKDIEERQNLIVPVLSSGYRYMVVPTSQAHDAGLTRCPNKGSHCACLIKESSTVLCDFISMDGPIDISPTGISLQPERGVSLSMIGGRLQVST